MNDSTLTIKTSRPALRVKRGKEMSINRKALYALGTPENILFWWSESQRVLLIGVAPEEAHLSFKISDRYYNTKTGFRIEKSNFLQVFLKIAGWHHDMVYAVTGEYISYLNMVAFRLDDAVELGAEAGTDE